MIWITDCWIMNKINILGAFALILYRFALVLIGKSVFFVNLLDYDDHLIF